MSLVEIRGIKRAKGMKEITVDTVVTSSKEVARYFYTSHDNIINIIKKFMGENHNDIERSSKISLMYQWCEGKDENGEDDCEILMNKDGFYFATQSFTDNEFLDKKLKYIKAFNELEADLVKYNYKNEYMANYERWESMRRMLFSAKKRGEEDFKRTVDFFREYIPDDLLVAYGFKEAKKEGA